MNNYYIDLSIQNSSDLLKNNNNNLLKNNNDNNSNLNNNGDLIEGFGNFGRVNLEKCCPLEYMWSENQKKCVKICDGCAIGAYGDINYEFLTSNGEFMSFAECVGDATEAYDFDKINRRYGIDELITQHDLNFHIDSDENTDGVQPTEDNPWAPVTSGMYQVSSKKQQMNIREDAITDEQRYSLQDGSTNLVEIEEQNLMSNNRTIICNASNSLQVNSIGEDEQISASYLLCNDEGPIVDGWTSLCSLDDFNNLDFGNLCDSDNLNSLCNGDDNLIKNLICLDNR